MNDTPRPSQVTFSPPLSRIPEGILCARDYETEAQRFIEPGTYAYIAGGSAAGETAAANTRAFNDLTLVPRVLTDVRNGHTRLNLGNTAFAHPVFLAPVAFQKLVHSAGEIETARAAATVESCMVLSTLSSCTLEDVAHAAGPSRWFQLYVQPEREVTLDLMTRAAQAGYRALVVTLDASIQVQGHRALRAGFRMSPETPANLRTYPVAPAPTINAGASRILQGAMGSAPVWDDMDWLLAQSPLPIWVKGVLHPDDAAQLQARGVNGLIVSNHGGRTLDGAATSLALLPEIRKAVGENYPLLFDSGIRSGADIFKALALGADAVLIGRLQVYALSVAGALGVAHMIKLLREELEICMAMTGCATLADIRKASLRRQEMRGC
jgi:isopentenyl diphosphate isomerase/L-lactate dehydrogenase-like FMN-dependent dehydrogenase